MENKTSTDLTKPTTWVSLNSSIVSTATLERQTASSFPVTWLPTFGELVSTAASTSTTSYPGSGFNVTDNGWTRDVCITTTEFSLTVNVITICLGLIIILGNCLVLFVLFFYPTKRFMPLNWLLCHLAVADLAIGITVFWWYGVAEILKIPVTLIQKVIFYGISIVAVMASLEGLTMIALDRYFLILKQTKYTAVFTRKRLIIALVVMWIVPVIIQIIAPGLGWSCVDKCDCRIQNEFSDAAYCFGEECSQILPPLTKEQLFIASVISFFLFLMTLFLYVIIFYGVRKQSQKLQQHLSIKKSNKLSTTASQHPATEKPTNLSAVNSISGNRNKSEWRHKLSTVAEQPPNDHLQSMNFSTFNKAFEFPLETLSSSGSSGDKSPNDAPNGVFDRQESKSSNSTFTTEVSLSPVSSDPPSIPKSSLVIYNKNAITAPKPRDDEEITRSGSNATLVMRPRLYCHKRQVSDSQLSVRQSVMRTFNRLTTRRSRRRTTASRKRDLKVMKSMFIIMSVFVATTAPLMFFIIYTFFNNDRSLKEIFNYLLQITTLNSLLNPFLYFWRIPHMRTNLLRLVRATYWRHKWRYITAWCRKQPAPVKPSKIEVSEQSWESGPSDSINRE